MFGISPMMIRELLDHKMRRDSSMLDLQKQQLNDQALAEARKLELERSRMSALSELEKSRLSALSQSSSSSSIPMATPVAKT